MTGRFWIFGSLELPSKKKNLWIEGVEKPNGEEEALRPYGKRCSHFNNPGDSKFPALSALEPGKYVETS